MVAELESYQDQLLSITQDVPGLIGRLTDDQFNWRPSPNQWSMAECFDHLNRTAAVYLPAIDAAIADATRRGVRAPGPFTHTALERMFARFNEPPPRLRARATKAITPAPQRDVADVLRELMEWQHKIGERIVQSDGLDLRRARTRWPIVPVIRLGLGATFAIMLSHERRHIWQARQVRNDRAFPHS